MRLSATRLSATGWNEPAWSVGIPPNAILFNGVPLLFNGQYITFTNV